MRENIICYLKLHSLLITNIYLLLILGFSLLLYFKKMGEIHREWTFSKKLLNFLGGKVFILYFILLIISVLFDFNSVMLNTKDLIPGDKIAESYGLICSSIITVSGVFAGFVFNKRQTYKEIVTRERIDWLHKMQENLAKYLDPTSQTNSGNLDKDNKTAYRLYYELIFNINHANDKDALDALNKYQYLFHSQSEKLKVNLALKDEVKLELVLDKGEEDEILLKIKNKSERDKLKDLISSDELKKIKIGNGNENSVEEEMKKKVAEEFTKIFNETWRDIKREAD